MILIYMNEKKECQGDIPSLDIFSEEKNDAAGEKDTLAGIMAHFDCIRYGSKKMRSHRANNESKYPFGFAGLRAKANPAGERRLL
jgi:hypothetical protein